VPGPSGTGRLPSFKAPTMTTARAERERLPNRRLGETFSFDCAGLRYTCTVGRFRDGRIAEAADTNARDAAIVASIALQHGADLETIRKALSRDGQGRASGALGTALDRLVDAP
jgi:hypothetical protein